jgi:poly(A) polymerase
MELLKLLVAPHATATLAVMAQAGLLLLVLGGVPHLADFENVAKVEATTGATPDAVRRLAALGVLIAEDAERLWKRLRLTNNEHERLASMAEGWRRISPAFGENATKALLYRLNPQHFTDHALLGWARSEATAHDSRWQELATLPRRWIAPEFPLKAADFMRRGLAQGPALGAALAAAERAWIAAGFPQEQRALDDIADAAAKSASSS